MAGNKYSSELLLQGKFEFDQNSLSSAAQFTQELVKTIEGPLQEMTQRIVSNLFGRQGLGQGFQSALVDQYGKPITSSQAPGGLPPVQGGPTGSPPPVGAATSPIQGVGNIFPPGQGPTSAAFQEYVKTQFRPIDFGELKAGITSAVGRPYSPEFEARNMALMMQKAQGAGVDVYSSMTSEQKEQFKTAANTMQARISEAVRIGQAEQASKSGNIKSVEDAMAAIEDHMSSMPDRLGQAYKEAQNELVALQKEHVRLQKDASDAAEQTAAGIQELKRAKDALEAPGVAEEAEKASQTAMRRLGFGTAIKAAAELGQFALERPYALAEARATAASMERGEARALLSGDIIRYGLIQELGGDKALKERSISSARNEYFLGAAGSIGAGILGGGIATSGTVGTALAAALGASTGGLGLLALAAGGAGAAYMGYKGAFEPEEKAKSYYEREISARAGESQELRGAMKSSYDRLKGSFRVARDLGDVGLEAMLYGGSTSQLTSDQLKNLGKEVSADEKIAEASESGYYGLVGSPSAAFRAQAAQAAKEKAKQAAKVSTSPSEAEYYKRGLVRDPASGQFVDLNTYGAKMGVDYSEIAAPMVGAFGRKFTADLGQQAINLKSLGISPETIAGFGAGELRQDPRDAFNRVKDLYAEAMSTGIEKSQLPRAMEGVSQMAAQLGLGGGAQAAASFGRSTTLAGEMFGPGYNVTQLAAAQSAQEFMLGRGGRFGGGGIGGAMRFMGTSKALSGIDIGGRSLLDLFGPESGFAVEMFSKGGMDAKSLRDYMKRQGATEEEIKKAEEQFAESQGGLAGPLSPAEREKRIEKGIEQKIGTSTLEGIDPKTRRALGLMKGMEASTAAAGVAEQGAIVEEGKMESAVKGTRPSAEAMRQATTGAAPATPGGAALSSELGARATELNTALVKVIETVPSFTEAVKNAAKSINDGLEALYPNTQKGFWDKVFGGGQ